MIPFPDETVNKRIYFLSFWFNQNDRNALILSFVNCIFPTKTNPKLWDLLHEGPFVSCVQSDKGFNTRSSDVINYKNTTPTITVPEFVSFRKTFSWDISFNFIAIDLTFSVTLTVFIENLGFVSLLISCSSCFASPHTLKFFALKGVVITLFYTKLVLLSDIMCLQMILDPHDRIGHGT